MSLTQSYIFWNHRKTM